MATVNLVIQITTKYSGWDREEVGFFVSYRAGETLSHTFIFPCRRNCRGLYKKFSLGTELDLLNRNYEGKVKNILLILISASNLNF